MKTERRGTSGVAEKKTRQITVKVDQSLYDRIIKACAIQMHREGQLARILIEWSLPYYERARSVENLQGNDALTFTPRLSRETQEVLFTTLRTILERAPSTVVEEASRQLTEWAGRFGDEEPAVQEHRRDATHSRRNDRK